MKDPKPNTDDLPIRPFVGWAALVVGLLLGWAFAEFCWRNAMAVGIGHWGRPSRTFSYYLLAILCSISLGVVGLALARFRDLPADE
jgi:hypothetical protein